MLTIKLFLENSGRTLRLDKDFPVYQGQFNNILLNVFVPTDILAPYFTKYADVNDTIISPYVAGTSVCVGSKTIARNGTYKESKKYYLRFVKTLVKDGVSYALFERKLPKEFTTYAGENNIIVNVNNVEFGEIKSANATTDSTHFVLGDLDLSKVQENLPAVSLNYTFKYNGTEWLLNGEIAVLEAYGINIESGTPEINDEILLKVYAEKANTTNITTTQPVTMEVMASNQFDGEPAISTSELETLQAYINELVAVLSHKQDKQDNGLQTQIKTVVGAINELVHLVGTNERVIGTYNFISSVVDRLPTNEEMLDFVRSVMGATYELQGNEVVYTIKDYAGIKTTYKSIYSDDTNKWLFYEVTQIMPADNGVKGIVEGTYGLGYNYDTIVKISGGRIVDIVIKVDGEYVNIRDAFTTEKWVKDYCKNNYAPIQLSQQLYFSKQGENNVISTLVPTDTTSVISGVVTSEIGEYELLKAKYTIPFDKLELTKDNKFRCILYVMANQDISVTFKLTTKVNNEIVNVEKSTTKTLVQDKYIKLEFENPFDKIVDKQEVVLNDIIEVTLFMTKEESGIVTFTTISTPDYPATYSLLLDTKAIVSGKIEQELGNNENSVISQKATTNIVGNYLVMSISSTNGSITKTDFEYLKEEFEYNGKKAQHRGIIAVNGTEKMEYKFEIEKDNKLYFIGSKMVGEVLTFYEMEIVKATEETYNWAISEKKAGGTTVSPIETATGTETGIDGLKIDNESYRVKGTIKPLETMPTGVTPKEIVGLETDGETYEIPRKEIFLTDIVPAGSVKIRAIRTIVDGVEKAFYFAGDAGSGDFINIQTIMKEANGFMLFFDTGSQFFLPIDDESNVEISTDRKSLIFKSGTVKDVKVDGVSVIVSDTAYIDLTPYAKTTALAEEVAARINADANLQTQINSLSGAIEVKVVETLPTPATPNTIYYVGTGAPYQIWLQTNDDLIYIGTTDIDLSGYQKKLNPDSSLYITDDGTIGTNIGGYYKSTQESVFQDFSLTGEKYEDNPNIYKVNGTAGMKFNVGDIFSGKLSLTLGSWDFVNEVAKTISITGLTTGTEYSFTAVYLLTLDISSQPLYLCYADDYFFIATATEDLSTYMALSPTITLEKTVEEVKTIKPKVVPIDETLQEKGGFIGVSESFLKKLFQGNYDAEHPVDEMDVFMYDPNTRIPPYVSAVWERVTSKEDCYLYISNTSLGTKRDESIQIQETVLTINQMPRHNHGGTITGGGHNHEWKGYVWCSGDGKQARSKEWIESDPTDAPTKNGGGTHTHTIAWQGEGNGHTHDAWFIQPQGISMGLWKRIS